MDYIEAFKNLKTNNKWGRKSPHKAVLMLTVIELYEKNILMDNEIRYDKSLKSTFLKMWNMVLPNEPLFHPDAYLPFWHLQSDNFWHIVPIRGKEDILSLMRDTNIKPSETKLIDSVKYAELDEDLYFLMTLPSGRSSLKKALLETYTTLTNKQIERLAESKDNAIDYSVTALLDYEHILSQEENKTSRETVILKNEIMTEFNKLNEDLRILFNFEYYSFLKKNRSERRLFLEICPTVYDLYHNIVKHPIKQGDITPSLAFIYENYLSDLRISLMSEDNSMELIDKINEAIDFLRGDNKEKDNVEQLPKTDNTEPKVKLVVPEEKGPIINTETIENEIIPERDFARENRKGKPWTKDEEEKIKSLFQQGKDTKTIAAIIGRTEVAIKSRLAKLGLINYIYGQEEPIMEHDTTTHGMVTEKDFTIENTSSRCYILNKNNEKVFSAEGKLKFILGKLYRLNLKNQCFTLKSMFFDGSVWMRGEKKIVAYPHSALYQILDKTIDYCEEVENVIDSPIFDNCRIKVKGAWYNNKGDLTTYTPNGKENNNNNINNKSDKLKITESPLYAVRKQAILRAMEYFRLPAKIKDIARTISRSAWGSSIKENDVEIIINTISEIESVDGKYILRIRR